MLHTRSAGFRLWFVLLVGISGPGIMAILNAPAETFWTMQTLLDVVRVALGGAWAALVALFVERPRRQWTDDERMLRLGYTDRERAEAAGTDGEDHAA